MKLAHTSILALALLFFSTSLSAQITSSLVPMTATANPAAYGYDAQSTTVQTKLSKRERQRLQRSLARRADDLADWDIELDEREQALYGRNVRNSRRPLTRNPLPARLLSQQDLFAWESRLDKLADRLRSKEAGIRQREARIDRHRRFQRDHYDRRTELRDDIASCREQCCHPKN